MTAIPTLIATCMSYVLLLSPGRFLISTYCVAGEPIWQPYTPQFGSHLDVAFTWSPVLWPWSGWISIFISVRETAYNWEGVAQGEMSKLFFVCRWRREIQLVGL